MAQALSLARLALGQVSPNPAVGAVVVKGGEIIGQGYTQPPGSDHAEIVALREVGPKARGGTLYVTLEPCHHHGRTPPCTQAIIDAGITEVYLSALDDNPLVSGRGVMALKEAGIRVYVGECQPEARELNEAYSKFITSGLPFVTAKYAMSLDGKIATRSGDSKWISGEEARHFVHSIRYASDAVMVGVNTVLADDPHLTARSCCGRGGTAHRQPLRVIVDDVGRMPHGASMFAEPGQTLLALGRAVKPEEKAAFTKAGAEVVAMPSDDGLVDLEGLLKYLAGRDVTSVLVEGGGVLLGSLFDLGLVDKVVCFIAPIIIGGAGARVPVAGRGIDKVTKALKLKRVSASRLGQDLMVSGYVVKE